MNLYFDQVAGKDWVRRSLNSAGNLGREKFHFVHGVNKRSRNFCQNVSRKINCAARFLKMTAMKNDNQKNYCGKRGGFILCVFRTGLPGNSAKVGAVGKIRVVQWAAQAEPEFPLECQPET